MTHPTHEQPDDVDRLFARLERAPVPEDLTSRVLAQTVARTNQRTVFAWPWLVAGLAAMAALTIAGYLLGASLASSDGLDVVEALFGDLSLVATAPGDVLAALGEVIPSGLLVLAAGSAGLMIWAAGRLINTSRVRQAA
jgi:hypothetical protein